MANRYVIDLDGCYFKINIIARSLPGVGMAVLSAYDIVQSAMYIVLGYQSRRDIKSSRLFTQLTDLGIPTDYALEAVDRVVDVIDQHIHACCRLRPHYSEHTYEFVNPQTLVIHEATRPPAVVTPTDPFWLDQIDDYYVGASLHETSLFSGRS